MLNFTSFCDRKLFTHTVRNCTDLLKSNLLFPAWIPLLTGLWALVPWCDGGDGQGCAGSPVLPSSPAGTQPQSQRHLQAVGADLWFSQWVLRAGRATVPPPRIEGSVILHLAAAVLQRCPLLSWNRTDGAPPPSSADAEPTAAQRLPSPLSPRPGTPTCPESPPVTFPCQPCACTTQVGFFL